MEQKGTRVTIVGSTYAEPGVQFVYIGRTEACDSCIIARVCHNLEPGRRYEVVAIRAATHICPVHHHGAVTVDVLEAPVTIRVVSQLAKKSTTITIKPLQCDEACEFWGECHPNGLIEGQKYIVTEVLDFDPIACRNGHALMKVQVIPLPSGLPRYPAL